jgi:Fe-S-cluster containining protein
MLPAVYHAVLPPFFDERALKEEKATCANCAMCPPEGGQALADVVYFRPDLKCCSYHPHLPNFLVGGILRDNSPEMAEGKRRIQEKIETRIGITPQWISAPRKRSILFKAARNNSFGRSLVLRCPYYQENGGLCTIWKHRESVCSTFFCKHSAGSDGHKFWTDLNTFLRHVETRLSQHAVQSIAAHLTEPSVRKDELTLEDLEDRPPQAAQYRAYWHEWDGREAEFYGACHDSIAALTREEFERILNDDNYHKNLESIEERYCRATTPKLPERLVLNPRMAARPVENGVLVTTYSTYETMMLSPYLYELLKRFGPGETVSQIRERLLRDEELDLPEAILIELYQLRIVIAA